MQEEIPVKRLAVRAVTDSEIFSQNGLPALGVFAGYFHEPGPLEYADIDIMEASLRTLLSTITLSK